MRRRVVGLVGPVAIALLTVVATLASACTRKEFDPHATAIEQARERVVPPMQAAVAAVVAGLDPYGTAEYDACGGGQDNFKVRDEYRYRCAAASRSVAGLEGQELELALEEARAQLRAAGCTGEPPAARPPVVWGGLFQCGDVELVVEIGAVLNNRFRDGAGEHMAAPCCWTVVDRRFDPVEGFVAANLAGHAYMLVATARGEYSAQCRDGQVVSSYRECPSES